MNAATATINQLAKTVKLLGSNGVWHPVTSLDAVMSYWQLMYEIDPIAYKMPGSFAVDIRGLVSPFDKKDNDVIQSYGVNGNMLTFQASLFPVRPCKFDTWVCKAGKFVFQDVVDQIINDEIVAYSIYTRGLNG
jgi:hypothetical protein